MGVQVLSPESQHNKHLRSLPRLPKNSHYSMKPLNNVKPSRALPTVPNSNLGKVDANVKAARALPRVPKPPNDKKNSNVLLHRHQRVLPEVPFKDNTNSSVKDSNTSGSSRTSTPRQNHRDNHHRDNRDNHRDNNHRESENHHDKNKQQQRALPRLPKLSQKQKPEQNRIEYMHEVYKKEGDVYSEDGNYEQALKSYNLALKFISDEKTTIVARSRVYIKLGKPRKAMQDADLALKLDPLYYEGLLQKAELLLEQGDYDKALNYFQKGARMRPDKEDFHDGMEKAKHAISENHKVVRKRKTTLSPDDPSVQKKMKDKGEKAKKNRDNVTLQRDNNVTPQRDNNVILQKQRTKSFTSDEHNNSYGSHSSVKTATHQDEAPPLKPTPPSQPPPAFTRSKLGRQMTPMPGRMMARPNPSQEKMFELQQQQQLKQQTQHGNRHPQQMMVIPSEEDVDEDMMKQILGKMYRDKDYLEKILGETENITIPGSQNLGPSAEHGLHFLYDRVLNWVRKGEAIPAVQPTPLPRETRTSARRKAMVHGTSVESLLEEQEKENQAHMARKRKKKPHQSKAPHTWYSFIENKKHAEAQEKKQTNNVFLHVVQGQKMKPSEHSNIEVKPSKHGPETTRRRSGLRRNKEFDSKESLNASITFKSYRPGSDMRNSKDRRSTPMELSDRDDTPNKTPPRINKKFEAHKEKLERRRAAVAKFVAKEMEDIELAYADNKYDDVTDKANHVMKILEHEDWPEKYETMAHLHSFLGNSCIGNKNYQGALDHHNKDLDIGEKHKIEESVSRALGNLGRIYVVQKRHQEALDMFLRKTPMCASRIETAWLFHEIGNCFLALGDFEYAKDSAKKSLEAAEEAVEWSYQLQSCVLMGVAEVKLKQYHSAFNTFEKALDQARIQGDEKAEDAIREALQDVNDRIVEEMRTKGPLNYPDTRSDAFMTPLSRQSSTLTDYQLQGLSRSRAEIARMQHELGPRFRADYAKTPAAQSEYSSIMIPDDDGEMSLTDTHCDINELNLDLERIRTDSTLFGSMMDIRDNIRSETFVSGKGK